MPDKPTELRWTSQLVGHLWDYQSRFPEIYFTYKFDSENPHSRAPLLCEHARVLDYGCGMCFLLRQLWPVPTCQGKAYSGSTRNVKTSRTFSAPMALMI